MEAIYTLVQSRSSGERFVMREQGDVSEIGEPLYHGDVASVYADMDFYWGNTTDEKVVLTDDEYADFRPLAADEI